MPTIGAAAAREASPLTERAAPRGVAIRTIHRLWSHRWFLLAAVVALSFGAYEAGRLLIGPEVVVDRVTRGSLVETVVATGNVLTPYRAQIGAQIVGTVTEMLVEEGQRVRKDQPLVQLDDVELKSALVQAQGALAESDARLRQLRDLTLPTVRETLNQQQATFEDAQKTYDRAQTLAQSGSETQAALDTARRDLAVARAQVSAAKLAVYTASPGGSDYVLAETQHNQALASLASATARLGYTIIKAPRDGVLITRNVEKGDVVQPGTALLTLAPDGVTQIAIQLDERNLGKIALGQKALVSADAYPKDRFAATVSYVNPGVDISRATVEVKLDVPNPPGYLTQDMTVSVDIDTARRDDTLALPMRSVHEALSGNPWVLAVRDGRALRQAVGLGLTGQNQVEILSGLAAGDSVAPSGSGVVSGQRVRAVSP